MEARTYPPSGSLPRYVVTQLTITPGDHHSHPLATKRTRTFYIVDLQDKARCVLKVEAGEYSPYRWGKARERAERYAEKMNDRYEAGLKAATVGS